MLKRLWQRSRGKHGHDDTHIAVPPAVQIDSDLWSLIDDIKDWQINHGSLLKLALDEPLHSVACVSIGVSVVPTPFPRACWDQAHTLAPIFNALYAAISEDDEWLGGILHDLVSSDEFTALLWSMHVEARRRQRASSLRNPQMVLGIFRSDYMLHRVADDPVVLKQVELNTTSIAGAVHATKVAAMHRHLARKNAYCASALDPTSLPVDNPSLNDMIEALRGAHQTYLDARPRDLSPCVLMIVQPFNGNVCDERPIEYGLWAKDVPCFRVVLGNQVMATCALTTDNGELLYRPKTSISDAREYIVSVIYFRAGFDLSEYTPAARAARLLLELSDAIKCPSISCHLAGWKRVQQALCQPGAVERFLPTDQANLVRNSFMHMSTLDDSSQSRSARTIAVDCARAVDYVLKPNLEGGGHNYYGQDISRHIVGVPQSEWHKYILMERIQPPVRDGLLMSHIGFHQGPVVSELGIVGICLWRRPAEHTNSVGQPSSLEISINKCGGWSFKTKDRSINEMSVVKGYGCFDSPSFVE